MQRYLWNLVSILKQLPSELCKKKKKIAYLYIIRHVYSSFIRILSFFLIHRDNRNEITLDTVVRIRSMDPTVEDKYTSGVIFASRIM